MVATCHVAGRRAASPFVVSGVVRFIEGASLENPALSGPPRLHGVVVVVCTAVDFEAIHRVGGGGGAWDVGPDHGAGMVEKRRDIECDVCFICCCLCQRPRLAVGSHLASRNIGRQPRELRLPFNVVPEAIFLQDLADTRHLTKTQEYETSGGSDSPHKSFADT